MRIDIVATLIPAAILAACAMRPDAPEAAQTTAYTGGRWYDGQRFTLRDVYVRDGVFVSRPRSAPSRVVDLAGGYVTPAFGEAHHHTVICDPERIGQFTDAGILYAAVMAAAMSTQECRREHHGPGSVEVVSALASITAPNAHPYQIGLYWLAPEAVENEWVYLADDIADLDRIFERVAEHRPDFLKIILSYSEDYERLRDDPSIESWYRGLDPALVPQIVQRAHAINLRVAAHVMSGHDFAVAVSGDADIIAHMPGFAPGPAFTETSNSYLDALTPNSPRYLITPQDAERAARNGVVVITTLRGQLGASAAANIALLREKGVRLLIGSDRGEGNSVDEALHLVHSGVMTAPEVVRSLSITTPRYFFPGRRIGEIATGAEATFVVLRGDPTQDIENLRAPSLVVQRGIQLRPALR